MALIAADRVRAYLTLVPYLLERGQVSVEDAAREFGVPPREMRALVEKLTVIGLPGDSGYWQQPHELFDINWGLLDDEGIIEITNDVGLRRVPRFTAREAAALLAGLQLAAALPGVADSDLVAGLIAKLSRSAAETPADVVVVPGAIDEVRTQVSRALSEGVAVSFRYRAPDAVETTRTVDPVRVLITDGQWYLEGWCHLREAMRTFHLDRVSGLALTDIPITHGATSTTGADASDAASDVVVFEMPTRLRPLLGDFVPDEAIEADGERSVVRLAMSDPRAVKRLAARFGGALVVDGPPAARAAVREWAAAGLALYHQPTDSVGG